MKNAYQKPMFDVKEFRFSEHIATSVNNCYWGGGATWTHLLAGCEEQYNPNAGGYIGLTGPG